MEGKYGTVGKADWLYHVKAFPGGASQWNVTEPGKKKRTVNRGKDLVLRRSQMTSEKAGDCWCFIESLLRVEGGGGGEAGRLGAGDPGSEAVF